MTDKEQNPLNEFHEQLREHYSRSDRERKQYDAQHPMADWWVCDNCGIEIRYNPKADKTVQNIIDHAEEHDISLSL